MLFLGIDPGIRGCLALYKPGDRDTGQRDLDLLDMPTMMMGESELVDACRAKEWIEDTAAGRTIEHAFIELVNAMPNSIPDKAAGFGKFKKVGMGASSAFKFGDRVATIRTVPLMMGIPLKRVVPRVWQKMFGLTGKDDPCKEVSARLPEFAHLFTRKKDDGRADATLIAIYGALKIGVPTASISIPKTTGL